MSWAGSFAARLSELLGQQVIFENVGGAGGMIGASRVAKAAPDGYQFVLGSSGTHALNQTLYKNPLYNAATDFAPVALVAEQPLVLVARKDLPADNLPEFIAYAKANQAKMQYGSAGVGSANHLACALLNAAIGINVTHVPYRGAAPAMQDLIAGRIDYSARRRDRDPADREQDGEGDRDPDRRTARRSCRISHRAHEQGLEDFEAYQLVRLLPAQGHARADRPEAPRRHRRDDEHAGRARAAEGTRRDVVAPERRSPEYLQKFVESEIEKWAGPIKAANIRIE